MVVCDLVRRDLVGVTWFVSNGEELDDLDIFDSGHDNNPHEVPHLLPTITQRRCFPPVLPCSSLASNDSLVAK
jgi:hypothetical protein